MCRWTRPGKPGDPGTDPSPTNELNSALSLVGTQLRLTDAGGTWTADMSTLVGKDGDWHTQGVRGKLDKGQSHYRTVFSLPTNYHHGFLDVTVAFHSYIGNKYHHASMTYYVQKQTGAPQIVTLATHYNVDGPGNLAINGLSVSGDDVRFMITNNDTSATYYTILYRWMVIDPW